MAPQAECSVFRFLDLPPELRNRIYYYVFTETSSHELNLLDRPPYYSNSAITSTSRKIRGESLSLYEQIVTDFWQTHAFYIKLDARKVSTNPEWIGTWCKYLETLPEDIWFRSLLILFSFENPHSQSNCYVQLEVWLNPVGRLGVECRLPPTTDFTQETVHRFESTVAESLTLRGLSYKWTNRRLRERDGFGKQDLEPLLKFFEGLCFTIG